MSGWWRRNAVALGALAILTPVTFGAVAWDGWQDYYLFRNTLPVNVAEGNSIDLIDTTWGPIRASELADITGFEVPPGSKVIAAAIPVGPHEESPSCYAPSLVQQSTGIRWSAARTYLGLASSSEEPERCVVDETDSSPYEMIVPFVVPGDVEGPFWVEVAPVEASPDVIRFWIDP